MNATLFIDEREVGLGARVQLLRERGPGAAEIRRLCEPDDAGLDALRTVGAAGRESQRDQGQHAGKRATKGWGELHGRTGCNSR